MKIAHVVPTYFPAVRYGGPIHAVHSLCRHLVSRGHTVDVFTTDVDGDGVLAPEHTGAGSLDGVGVRYFPVRQPRRLYYSPALADALSSRIREYDVVHLHSVFLYPTLKAARCATRHAVPYVIAPRGMLVKDLIGRKNPMLKKAWVTLFERRTVEEAAAVHVTSTLEEKELRRFGFSLPPVYEIPNGVEFPVPAPSIERESDLVLFLGRLDWKKGIERLIGAVAALESVRLVIAGNDESGYARRLEEQCRRLGIEARVRFVGPVSGDDKWRWYRRASLFVLPSLSENFANTVLEAMSMECPVAVTPEVGLAGIVERAGAGIVIPGDPGKMAESIAALLANTAEAQRMGRNGRALVEARFAWEDVAAATENLYRQITGRSEVRSVA